MVPAEQLAGLKLDDDWTAIRLLERKPNATGGFFSKGYIAERSDGTRGFLKALDYASAFASPDPAGTLQALTNAYVFERDLCQKCAHLRNVARAVSSGSIRTNPSIPYSTVEYLIFELAEGDVRAFLDLMDQLDHAFAMRSMHNISVGLKQLHGVDIAHQDLKPSNVLIFESGKTSKVCDLGRAWDKATPAPHDTLPVAGDRTYAPINQLYQHSSALSTLEKRMGCDLYHLGNILFFIYTRTHVNAVVVDGLAAEHRPTFWTGTYEEVLPFLQASFEMAVSEFSAQVPDFLRQDLTAAVVQLCNPDIRQRGHPLNRQSNQFSLERYIAMFDLLEHRARLSLVKRTRQDRVSIC